MGISFVLSVSSKEIERIEERLGRSIDRSNERTNDRSMFRSTLETGGGEETIEGNRKENGDGGIQSWGERRGSVERGSSSNLPFLDSYRKNSMDSRASSLHPVSPKNLHLLNSIK